MASNLQTFPDTLFGWSQGRFWLSFGWSSCHFLHVLWAAVGHGLNGRVGGWLGWAWLVLVPLARWPQLFRSTVGGWSAGPVVVSAVGGGWTHLGHVPGPLQECFRNCAVDA